MRIVGSAVIVLAAVVGACGPKHLPPSPTVGEWAFFPPPPDTPRVQFLTGFGSSTDVTGKEPLPFWRALIGDTGEGAGDPIMKPYGVAIHGGKIYVCDSVLGGLEILDLRARAFRYFRPEGPGRVEKPINCFVDPRDGRLYVADVGRREVLVFDTAGDYVGSITEPEGAFRPTDVFVEGSTVWVCDIDGHLLRAYRREDFSPLGSFPHVERGAPEYLYIPTNLYVWRDRVYVSDLGDFRVKWYSRDGELLGSVGGIGAGWGQFHRPKGIAVDRDGNLYVVDAAFQNVQLFDPEGRLLTFFGGPDAGAASMGVPAKVVVDYENLDLFRSFVHPDYELKHLILVTNQVGRYKVSVYGFVEPKQGRPGAP